VCFHPFGDIDLVNMRLVAFFSCGLGINSGLSGSKSLCSSTPCLKIFHVLSDSLFQIIWFFRFEIVLSKHLRMNEVKMPHLSFVDETQRDQFY
jgi:hypothetical protein